MEENRRTYPGDILSLKCLVVSLLGAFSLYVIVFTKEYVTFRIRGTLLILLSFCLSYLLTPVMCGLAWRFGIVDRPNQRKMHKKVTPLLGGVVLSPCYGIHFSSRVLFMQPLSFFFWVS